ncbi:MAG: helix-hairpin-helix domain-containing protein [Myxococcota bacterium]
MSSGDPQPGSSIARGALVIAIIVVMATAALQVTALLPGRSSPPPPRCCVSPIEVVDGHGTRISCLGDRELAACLGLSAGDRVELKDSRCVVHAGEMSAGLRLLLGLKLDLNRVQADDLELLDGIGPRLATAIVSDRERVGAFRRVDELQRVKGIGPRLLERLQPFLTVPATDDIEAAPKDRSGEGSVPSREGVENWVEREAAGRGDTP